MPVIMTIAKCGRSEPKRFTAVAKDGLSPAQEGTPTTIPVTQVEKVPTEEERTGMELERLQPVDPHPSENRTASPARILKILAVAESRTKVETVLEVGVNNFKQNWIASE